MAPAELLQGLGTKTLEGNQEKGAPTDQSTTSMSKVLAPLLPLLAALPAADVKDKPEGKPCYLVAKGLPTLPLKLVEKVCAPWLVAWATMESPLSKDPRTRQYAASPERLPVQKRLYLWTQMYQLQ